MKTTLELLKQSLYLSKGTSVGRLDNELVIFITVQQVSKLKKNSKSPFGNHQRKNGRQMQKCSRQIVQEQKLRLEPHLIDIVVRLLELNTLKNILW